jgi:hypothetical protein
MVGQNTLFIGAGTYSVSSAPPALPAGAVPTLTQIVGYNTVRGDITTTSGLTRPVIQASAGMTAILAETSPTIGIFNLTVDGNAKTTTGCISQSQSATLVFNCRLIGFTSYGFTDSSTTASIINTEVSSPSNTVSTAALLANSTGEAFVSDYVHDVAAPGISFGTLGGGTVKNCVIASCTGASSDGIFCATYPLYVYSTDIYGCGRDAIHYTSNSAAPLQIIQNNIFANNGGAGINMTYGLVPYSTNWDYNAFLSNTGGNVVNIGTASGFVMPLSQSLSGSPWVNVSTSGGLMNNSNFALNNTAGGGLACQGTGSPSAFPGTGITNSNTYIGAIGPTPSAGIIGRGRAMN